MLGEDLVVNEAVFKIFKTFTTCSTVRIDRFAPKKGRAGFDGKIVVRYSEGYLTRSFRGTDEGIRVRVARMHSGWVLFSGTARRPTRSFRVHSETPGRPGGGVWSLDISSDHGVN